MSTELSLDLQYVVTMVAVTMEMTWFIGYHENDIVNQLPWKQGGLLVTMETTWCIVTD